MKPFIPTAVYGFFNYAMGLLMMASPWLFGFDNQHGGSLLLPIYLGWLQIIMAIFSKHEWGIIKIFPVPMHCFIDVIAGMFLMCSPFIYNFTYEIWLPQFLCGLVLLLLGVFVKGSPVTDEPKHVFKDGLLQHIGDVNEPMSH